MPIPRNQSCSHPRDSHRQAATCSNEFNRICGKFAAAASLRGKAWDGAAGQFHTIFRRRGVLTPNICCFRLCGCKLPRSWPSAASRVLASLGPICPLRPMKSHGIPSSRDENGTVNRGDRPRTGEKQASYRHPLSSNDRSGAHASRHPPRCVCAVGHPAMGQARRIGQWQPLDPPLSFPGCVVRLPERHRTVKEPQGSGGGVQRRIQPEG